MQRTALVLTVIIVLASPAISQEETVPAVTGADGRFQNAYVPHTDHLSPEILVHPEGRKVLIVDASVSLWVELNPSSEDPQHDG